MVSGSCALPPRWPPQCSCVVIESHFDPGERLQAPGSLWLYSIFELQHERIKISVNKIESKLHFIVLLRLFENKMATTAVRKLFIQSLCECLTTYVDAHQKLAHTLTLIFFDCNCMIEFNLYLF